MKLVLFALTIGLLGFNTFEAKGGVTNSTSTITSTTTTTQKLWQAVKYTSNRVEKVERLIRESEQKLPPLFQDMEFGSDRSFSGVEYGTDTFFWGLLKTKSEGRFGPFIRARYALSCHMGIEDLMAGFAWRVAL